MSPVELPPTRWGQSGLPQPAAVRLRVAVCIDSRYGPGRERLSGVYEYAARRDWDLLLVPQDDANAIAHIAEMDVDGAILFDRSRQFHERLREHRVYCVETSARHLELDHAAIYVDDEAIGRVAAQHLAGLRLEHFAYCGPAGDPAPSDHRAASFRAQLRSLGFPTDTYIVTAGGESPLAPLIEWLRVIPKPLGILAFDDKVAERVLVGCRWAELRVPEDIAVVGVGNDELLCELAEPGISSIRIPGREIGRLAAATIEAHHHGQAIDHRRAFSPTEIVVRASTERQLRPDPAIRTAIQVIRARAHQPFGTDQLADAVGIPRRTLERRFVASTGKTVHTFISDFRMHLAKRLLRSTRAPIHEVARQCGYSALSAFTRMFQERIGCHPEAFRARLLSSG